MIFTFKIKKESYIDKEKDDIVDKLIKMVTLKKLNLKNK